MDGGRGVGDGICAGLGGTHLGTQGRRKNGNGVLQEGESYMINDPGPDGSCSETLVLDKIRHRMISLPGAVFLITEPPLPAFPRDFHNFIA